MTGKRGIVPFGNQYDLVRVRVTPETVELELAGLTGDLLEEVVPSETGLMHADVVGNLMEDHAVRVHFGELFRSYWFAKECLELIDLSPGETADDDGESESWAVSRDWLKETYAREWQVYFWAAAMFIVVAVVVFVWEWLQSD